MAIIFIIFILIFIIVLFMRNSVGDDYYQHRSYDTTNDRDISSKTEEQECDEYYEWKINRK